MADSIACNMPHSSGTLEGTDIQIKMPHLVPDMYPTMTVNVQSSMATLAHRCLLDVMRYKAFEGRR